MNFKSWIWNCIYDNKDLTDKSSDQTTKTFTAKVLHELFVSLEPHDHSKRVTHTSLCVLLHVILSRRKRQSRGKGGVSLDNTSAANLCKLVKALLLLLSSSCTESRTERQRQAPEATQPLAVCLQRAAAAGGGRESRTGDGKDGLRTSPPPAR